VRQRKAHPQERERGHRERAERALDAPDQRQAGEGQR
jgi:hypothetical protein